MSESSAAGMSVIVQTVAGWLRAPILVFGIYTVLYGHLGPGGGFAGGVMIATGLGLGTLAYGETPARRHAARSRAVALCSAGALLFLATACLGVVTTRTFLENIIETPVARHFTLLSGGLIPVYEIGIALLVAGGLYAAFCGLAAMQRRVGSDGAGPEEK